MYEELCAKVEALQTLIVEFSTGQGVDIGKYESLRKELCNNPITKDQIPDFVKSYRTLDQFWPFIKREIATYAGRREYIWNSFAPLLNFLECQTTTPAEAEISLKMSGLKQAYIHQEWDKALKRKIEDPEGAITSSRTLIETVCKHLLDEMNVEYIDGLDLPKLYKLTAQNLNLAPDQHNEAIFKQILGGCQTIVEGLGSLRNKLSDAHGKGTNQTKPSERHAELAVNLAGTMAIFLLETYQVRNGKTGSFINPQKA